MLLKKNFAQFALLGLLLAMPALNLVDAPTLFNSPKELALQQPNIVLIYTDDVGYGDIGVYNPEVTDTPRIDALAAEGVMMTDFYTNPICTPSRAALLTGRHATRSYLTQALGADSPFGLLPWEETVQERLQDIGYKTGMVGKWHLGDHPQYFPTRHGFESFYGVLYSNNLKPLHLMSQERVLENEPDQALLLRQFTEQAKAFITDAGEDPFFLYFPHTAPHAPNYVTDEWARPADHTIYEDVIHELDWSVGEILDHLEALDLADDTIVIFTSDNGPLPPGMKIGEQLTELYDEYGRFRYEGGSAGILRGGKGSIYEGGVRVPMIVRWPNGLGNIPEGGRVVNVPAANIDFYPTLLHLVGGELPSDRMIDGENIIELWRGTTTTTQRTFYFFDGRQIGALRSGNWKLHFDAQMNPTELYDLSTEGGLTEQENVLSAHEDVATSFSTEISSVYSSIADDRTLMESLQHRVYIYDIRLVFFTGAMSVIISLVMIGWLIKQRKTNRH